MASYSGAKASGVSRARTSTCGARLEQVSSLAGEVSRSAVRELIDCLSHRDPLVCWAAGVALSETAGRLRRRARLGLPIWKSQKAEMTFSGLFALLRASLEDGDPRRRAATADALALCNYEPAVTCLARAMEDAQPLVRVSAAMALGRIGDKAAVGSLLSAVSDPSIWVRRAAAEALGAIGDPRAVPALEQALADSQPLVRASAVCALGHMPTARARKALERCARDGDTSTRWYCARGLGRIGKVSSVPVLERLKEDKEAVFGRSTNEVATAAIDAIERRERGPWNRLRKAFYAIRRRCRRRPRGEQDRNRTTQPE